MSFRSNMGVALEEARAAAARGEVPVGAVLVAQNGEVLARAGNRTRELNDPTAHAEIRALREAGVREDNYRLPQTTLYVTLEPCTMCCGALVHARVANLIFATREPRAGAVISTATALDNPALNHMVRWREGLLSDDSAVLLQQFFQRRRLARSSEKPMS